MNIKYFTRTCAILLATLLMSACEGTKKDVREPFIGEYTFVSTGDVDLYAGVLKITTIPMNEEGKLSIFAADEPNQVWMVAGEDTTLGHVKGNELYLDSLNAQSTYNNLVLNISFTYEKATLEGNQLSWVTNAKISATYNALYLSGIGKVNIVATKVE